MDSQYWPPTALRLRVERVGWFEGTEYEDEFLWDPTTE